MKLYHIELDGCDHNVLLATTEVDARLRFRDRVITSLCELPAIKEAIEGDLKNIIKLTMIGGAVHKLIKPFIVKRPHGCQVLFPLEQLDDIIDGISGMIDKIN